MSEVHSYIPCARCGVEIQKVYMYELQCGMFSCSRCINRNTIDRQGKTAKCASFERKKGFNFCKHKERLYNTELSHGSTLQCALCPKQVIPDLPPITTTGKPFKFTKKPTHPQLEGGIGVIAQNKTRNIFIERAIREKEQE